MSQATTTVEFAGTMTLDAARAQLRPLAADGHKCPLCRQWVQIRKRALANAPVRLVEALYLEHHNRFGFVPAVIDHRLPDISRTGGWLYMGQHWGLIEPETTDHRPEGGRDGHWRVTQKGIDFLLGNIQVPKYAEIYNARCYGNSGPLVSRDDILGETFDVAQLRDQVDAVPTGLLDQTGATA